MSTADGVSCGAVGTLETRFGGVTDFRLRQVHTEEHAHRRPSLVVGVSGALSIESRGGSAGVLAIGAMYVLPAGLPHRERVGPRPARCLLLTDARPAWDRLTSRRVAGRAVGLLAARLAEALDLGDVAGAEATASELIALAELESARRSASGHRLDWVGGIAACLDQRFPRLPSLAALAGEAGVSREHLSRVFRRTTGLTVGQYVRRRRVLEGASRLRERRADLSEVANACGFADQSHFTREFRRHFGTTPRRYRDSHVP